MWSFRKFSCVRFIGVFRWRKESFGSGFLVGGRDVITIREFNTGRFIRECFVYMIGMFVFRGKERGGGSKGYKGIGGYSFSFFRGFWKGICKVVVVKVGVLGECRRRCAVLRLLF